jgi:hypothetical protein
MMGRNDWEEGGALAPPSFFGRIFGFGMDGERGLANEDSKRRKEDDSRWRETWER